MSEYNTFAKALNLAGAAHRKQVRKGDIDGRKVSYLIHPVKVCYTVSSWTQGNYRAMAIAVLHDVLEDANKEDKPYFAEKIKELGDDIYQSVIILTKLPKEDYGEYIQKIADSGNLTAVMVKLADIFANMNDCVLFTGEVPEKTISKAAIIYEKFKEVVERNDDNDNGTAMYFLRTSVVGLGRKLEELNDPTTTTD